jgi:hypothetical protein
VIRERSIGDGDLATMISQTKDLELPERTHDDFHRCCRLVTTRVGTESPTDGFGLSYGIFWQFEIEINIVLPPEKVSLA